MKAETKETIRWIKERLNYSCVKDTTDEKMLEKAIKLLDSLPRKSVSSKNIPWYDCLCGGK